MNFFAARELVDERIRFDIWSNTCRILGVEQEDINEYEKRAIAYAQTTTRPNSDVVEAARAAVLAALMRGEPFPADPEAAIKHEQLLFLAKLLQDRAEADRRFRILSESLLKRYKEENQ